MLLRIILGIISIAGFIFAHYSAVKWTPQLGTTNHPKVPDLSPMVRQGDIFQIAGELYRALVDIDLTADPRAVQSMPEEGRSNEYWRSIKHGSYMLPKIFGKDSFCEEGDLFYVEGSNTYYKATKGGRVLDEWALDIKDRRRSSCGWQKVQEKENWMSLLRPEIGDTRLGDLIMPGSHDAGTWGINNDSILVDRNFLFQVAEMLTPETIVNWSITQPDKFDLQLTSGFRNLDMRIADLEEYDGSFRWWHGMTGDDIMEGLDHVANFSRDHPEEILILDWQHFAAPGNSFDPTQPVPTHRKDMISDIILDKLGDYMAPRNLLSSNPSVNEVLATGANIVAVMRDSYIKNKDNRYWESGVLHASYQGRANPEELFVERSGKLEGYLSIYSNQMTDLSAATTPNEKTMIAGLLTVYGNDQSVLDIIEELFPGLENVDPRNMSYEGLWTDLVYMARYGTNTAGMRARPMDLYTNGASVHYSGVNDQLRYWAARPHVYKPNVVYTDDFVSSTFVDTAILANRGDIPREFTIAHQGNPLMGYFLWVEEIMETVGGADGLGCSSVYVSYVITDEGSSIDTGNLGHSGLLTLQEGQYPPGSSIDIYVSSDAQTWHPLWSAAIIQDLIDLDHDVYIRGTDLGSGSGFAYVSTVYDDFGLTCDTPPLLDIFIIASISW